ncbi:MAG: helicase-related protein [Flavobacteriales bacterium]|jgi:SNF2 family DNA or RNA helicase|nr:helicase-related protein [Flavobacteriales bacterium]
MPSRSLFPPEQRTTIHLSSIKDNRSHGKVGDWLKEKIQEGSALSIVSAYFTVNAYAHLREELEGIDHLRFLFGDPAFIKVKDENKPRRNFRMTDEGLKMAAQVQQRAVAKACADWLERKADIRSLVRPNFLHGKLYHIGNPNKTEEAITGSSNFTAQGLGFGNTPNMELNMVINDRRDREELKQWFEELWNDESGLVEDVKQKVLDDLKLLFAETPPEFVYFKTLYHVFEKFLKDEEAGSLLDDRTGFLESEIWNMLFAFQKDGVKGAINKIKAHGGCIIADSVGLGKTFEALAVIKYFEGLGQNVLVLCPKKLAQNWMIYQSRRLSPLSPFKKDKFNYRLLYHTDMGRTRGTSDVDGFDMAHFPWGAWDLIVIDESHNFRGNPEIRTGDDGNDKFNRTAWLLKKLISEGVKSKVLLLTATPVNTNLRDLRNQIKLIQGADEATAQLLKRAQAQFTNWADPVKNPDRNVKQLMEQLDSAFFKLLDKLTIARSRNHIKTFYSEEVIGHFPKRARPVSIAPDIDLENRFLSYDTINDEILKYELAVYNPSRFIDDAWVAHYEQQAALEGLPFSQGKRERLLIHMMKKGFLKRLESSIHSFAVSMERTIQRIEALEQRIKAYQKMKAAAAELEAIEPDADETNDFDEDAGQWEVGKRMKFKLAHMESKLDEWLSVLANDKRTMVHLYNTARAIDAKRDAKLEELKKLITAKTYKQHNPGNKKVIVFTAFADTAEYLYDSLKDFVAPELKSHIALVTGTNNQTTFGRNEFNHILTNFSPISKQRALKKDMPQDGCIDVLIASDCISEGQNLQDCDYLINYDIHWNPVRVIQRFGRIDRLGSTNATVHLVNFWPTEDLDKYIDLKVRVETRMALVDLAATADDNLLTNEQVEELISEDLKYRNRQLKKLKEEVLDIEESGDTLSLTDLTLDDFRTELLNFLKGNEERLRDAPEGIHAVVPSPGHAMGAKQYDMLGPGVKDVIKPGVLLCLRERKQGDDEQQKAKEAINVTAPYFLVYVRDDGTVRFSFTQPKQTLEVFRSLCQGKSEAYMELCELFNKECEGGMDRYNKLVERATTDIAALFRKRAGTKLGTDRNALLIPDAQQVSTPDDFDLVTWLVIK